MCARCAGILLGDTPQKELNGKVFHYPLCYDKEKNRLHFEGKKKYAE